MEISQKFVAFSEYMNFTYKACIIDFKPGRSLETDYVSHGKIQGQLA